MYLCFSPSTAASTVASFVGVGTSSSWGSPLAAPIHELTWLVSPENIFTGTSYSNNYTTQSLSDFTTLRQFRTWPTTRTVCYAAVESVISWKTKWKTTIDQGNRGGIHCAWKLALLRYLPYVLVSNTLNFFSHSQNGFYALLLRMKFQCHGFSIYFILSVVLQTSKVWGNTDNINLVISFVKNR